MGELGVLSVILMAKYISSLELRIMGILEMSIVLKSNSKLSKTLKTKKDVDWCQMIGNLTN